MIIDRRALLDRKARNFRRPIVLMVRDDVDCDGMIDAAVVFPGE
jgi:hypothetical protein